MSLLRLSAGQRFAAACTGSALLSVLLSTSPARAAQDYLPTAADNAIQSLLHEARHALKDIDSLPAGIDRDTAYTSALASLAELYDLYGCEWASPQLQRLYASPDCPDMHIGWSNDGRVGLRIETLELKSPAFKNWRVYLLTLEGDTSLDTLAKSPGSLRFELADGREVAAQVLTEQHPLWKNLAKLSTSFHAPEALPSGAVISFKQLVPLADLGAERITDAKLDWGPYAFDIDYFSAAGS